MFQKESKYKDHSQKVRKLIDGEGEQRKYRKGRSLCALNRVLISNLRSYSQNSKDKGTYYTPTFSIFDEKIRRRRIPSFSTKSK
jgi:hypothetical protein